MKKALLVVCALAVAALSLTSCVSTHYESGEVDTLEMKQLAVKDYDIIAPVTVTATETQKNSAFYLHLSDEGQNIVYPALLEAAQKVGGQDVINVRVTKKTDSEVRLGGIFGCEKTYTYTATALAIKYNNKNFVDEVETMNERGFVTKTSKVKMVGDTKPSIFAQAKAMVKKITSKLPKLF